MLLIIDYPDGTSESLTAELVGGVVSYQQDWVPGILIEEPKRCFFKSDLFEAALNEGHLRFGEIKADPETRNTSGFAGGSSVMKLTLAVRNWLTG